MVYISIFFLNFVGMFNEVFYWDMYFLVAFDMYVIL